MMERFEAWRRRFPEAASSPWFSMHQWLLDAEHVQQHNANANHPTVHRLAMTKYAGTTDDDFVDLMSCSDDAPVSSDMFPPFSSVADHAPFWQFYSTWIDYTNYGIVSMIGNKVVAPPKDQLSCGCCYIIAALAQYETYMAIRTGQNVVPMSIQPFLQCLDASLNGCNGGRFADVLALIATYSQTAPYMLAAQTPTLSTVADFVFNNPAINAQCDVYDALCRNKDTSDNPICTAPLATAKCNSLLPCQPSKTCLCANVSLTQCLPQRTCFKPFPTTCKMIPFIPGVPDGGLMTADYSTRVQVYKSTLKTYGPFAISILSVPELKLWDGQGMLYPATYKTKQTNHAVLLIGYNEQYWIIQNSWGITRNPTVRFPMVTTPAYGMMGPLNMLQKPPIVFCT